MQIFGSFTLPSPEAEEVSLYKLEKTSLETTDQSLLDTVDSPKHGDIAVITTTIEEVEYQKSAYIYDTNSWIALNGNVEADKVILTKNITLAGNYTQFGNLTKTQTGTAEFECERLSLMQALTNILSQRLQPKNPTLPYLGNVTISRTGYVECGTEIPSINVSKVTLNPGSYEYGPATGVTATSWTTTRVSNNGDVAVDGAGEGGVVTDNFGGTPIKIGDQTGDYSTLKYRVTAQYSDGAVAYDNLKSESNPPKKISAGSTNKESGTITAFRKFFYGTSTDSVADINSAFIRTLTGSSAPCKNGQTFSITIPDGTKTVVIAYPASFRNLTSVKDVEAFGTDITTSFNLTTVKVEGADGYTAIDYKVYAYKPAAALGKNTYNVTI